MFEAAHRNSHVDGCYPSSLHPQEGAKQVSNPIVEILRETRGASSILGTFPLALSTLGHVFLARSRPRTPRGNQLCI